MDRHGVSDVDALLPEKDPAESVVVEFDFYGELTAPTIATLSVTPINGADPAAASMLDGSYQISGASVLQRIKLGVDKLNYKLRCEAAQGGDVRVRAAILPVRQA